MNKYQEALNYFCDHCMEYEDDYDWEENPCGEYVKVDEEILKEKRAVLQELVDKATPKKPYMDILNAWCPSCRYALGREFAIFGMARFSGQDHCPNCGQALKWKEENDDEK